MMASNLDSAIPQLQLEQPHKAGDVEPFPSGRVTYLAPLPLPTSVPPHGPHIGELNDVHIDFGMPSPEVFMWQVTLGGPFTFMFMLTVLSPLLIGFIFFLLGEGWDGASHAIEGMFHASFETTLITGFFSLFLCLAVWLNVHNKRITLIPTRFNRQRREVCFMLNGATEPTFIPWESLSAWVIEAQGVTQYGV
ncbi:hypothetical protein SAMN04487857_1491, partial [Pseudomonas sp. ok272]